MINDLVSQLSMNVTLYGTFLLFTDAAPGMETPVRVQFLIWHLDQLFGFLFNLAMRKGLQLLASPFCYTKFQGHDDTESKYRLARKINFESSKVKRTWIDDDMQSKNLFYLYANELRLNGAEKMEFFVEPPSSIFTSMIHRKSLTKTVPVLDIFQGETSVPTSMDSDMEKSGSSSWGLPIKIENVKILYRLSIYDYIPHVRFHCHRLLDKGS